MASVIRIGTRGSRLALWQANFVAELLKPWVTPVIEIIETAGDQVRDVPLSQIGGQGVFTKELQGALLDDRIDLAVHSLKDLPTVPVNGLSLTAVPRRGPTGDVLVSRAHPSFERLPAGATVATSSVRRRAQILHRRPDLRVVSIRGNVETRLRKLVEERLDALVLAQAGLERLGLADAVTEVLDPTWMFPAVGQGRSAWSVELMIERAKARHDTWTTIHPIALFWQSVHCCGHSREAVRRHWARWQQFRGGH
jgi:hydroxymethylbilane synthase